MKTEGLYNPTGQTQIIAKSTHNLLLKQRPRIDPSKTSSENFLDRLVRPVQELFKSVTKTSSKVHESKTYNQAVNNLSNGNECQKAINKKL